MISIIITVRNNVHGLKQTLVSLVSEKEGHEVLVVDGGSLDGSVELARGMPWVTVVKGEGPPARLKNEGARKATGSVILFIEAGVVLERGWSQAVVDAAAGDGFALGCFRMEVTDRNPVFRLIELTSMLRTWVFGISRARQVQFVKAEDVDNEQVFIDVPALEDLELSRRMGSQGRVVQVSRTSLVSAARWHEAGLVSRVRRDAVTFMKWYRGEQPTRLAAMGGEKSHAVILFVRNPEPGKVKKWLGAMTGNEQAAALYRSTVETILATVDRARLDADKYLFFRPKKAREEMERWLGRAGMLLPAPGRTSGERRKQAVENVFELNTSKALILGSNCPALSATELTRALRALDEVDMVLGPTDDGGCYLVGIKAAHPEVFEGLEWGAQTAYAELLQAAQQNRLSCTSLNPLRDFDSEEDVTYNWAMGFIQG